MRANLHSVLSYRLGLRRRWTHRWPRTGGTWTRRFEPIRPRSPPTHTPSDAIAGAMQYNRELLALQRRRASRMEALEAADRIGRRDVQATQQQAGDEVRAAVSAAAMI